MALKGSDYAKWQAEMKKRRQKIKKMAESGIPYCEIGRKLGISRQRARQLALMG